MPFGGLGSTAADGEPVAISRRRDGATDPVHVTGRFAVSADVRDEQSPGSYRLGPYLLETFLDGTKVFSTRMERFSYPRTHETDIAFDYALNHRGSGRFLRQFALFGRALEVHCSGSIAGGVLDAGWLADSEGGKQHELRLAAADADGNKTDAVLEIVANRMPVVTGLGVDHGS